MTTNSLEELVNEIGVNSALRAAMKLHIGLSPQSASDSTEKDSTAALTKIQVNGRKVLCDENVCVVMPHPTLVDTWRVLTPEQTFDTHDPYEALAHIASYYSMDIANEE